jgi:hypothetical protein
MCVLVVVAVMLVAIPSIFSEVALAVLLVVVSLVVRVPASFVISVVVSLASLGTTAVFTSIFWGWLIALVVVTAAAVVAVAIVVAVVTVVPGAPFAGLAAESKLPAVFTTSAAGPSVALAIAAGADG